MGKAQADPGAYGNRPAYGLNSRELRGTRRHACNARIYLPGVVLAPTIFAQAPAGK